MRLENGLFAPKKWPVMGSDFAGEIAATGEGVTELGLKDPELFEMVRFGYPVREVVEMGLHPHLHRFAAPSQDRITSYNVCYTKLLRYCNKFVRLDRR